MNKFEKIINIDSELQAQIIEEELKQRNIPHLVRNYHDSALDGLYQTLKGWGHIEASPEFKDEIIMIVDLLNNQPVDEVDDSQQKVDVEDKRKNRQYAILTLLFFVFAFICFLMLRDWYVNNYYYETAGRVISVRMQAIGQNVNLTDPRVIYGSHLVVAYQVNGKEVYGEVDVSNTLIQKGEELTVLYSVNNPEKCLVKNKRK